MKNSSKEKTFVMFVNEAMQLIITDLTNYNLNGTVADLFLADLMSIINRDINQLACQDKHFNCENLNQFSLNDVFCDGLVSVAKDKIYALPCKALDIKFLMWFYMERNGKKFTFTIFAKKSNINSDSLGRNSIATFSIKNQTFVLTSGYDNPNLLGLNIFDISKITNREVTEITSHIYSYLNFSSEVEALQRFNIRDIKSFSPIFSPNSKISKAEKYHFIIMSCFNNGLIYFKGINLNNTFSFNSEAEEIKYLQLSYIYNITGIGKIFTEKEYYNDTKVEFFFYSSTSYPPVVYEFLVDEYLNMNINRIYDSNFVEQIRYAGNDMIAVNENFIAFLLYDLKSLVQTIRVFYRDETNFGLGHTHIPLLNLKSPISAMRFLSFNTANDIFVINPEKWSIERINDYEIIFNLYNKKEEYLPYCNRTFEAIIKAMNEDKTATYLQLKFNITFANQTDMDSYYIESNVVQTIDCSYGDNLFNFSISEFYSGPDLRFEYRLNSSSLLESDTKIFNTFDLSINEKISSFDYQEDNIVLPKIVNTFAEEIQTHKFNSSYSCTKNIICRFSDRLSGEQMVSIFCLLDNFIEHHIFKISNMIEVQKFLMDYPHSKFIDNFQIEFTELYAKYKDILLVLSDERDSKGPNYIIHVFDIDKDILIWIDKFKINTYNKFLRDEYPIISIVGTTWMIVVDKSETQLYFISDNQGDINATIKTQYQVNYAYLTKYNYLFISFINNILVQIYTVYFSKEETSKNIVTLEMYKDLNFTVQYLDFDIDEEGLALYFFGYNSIQLWSMKNVFSIEYVRQLPLFRYSKDFRFAFNTNPYDLVYIRYEGFLYIVFTNSLDIEERYLLIYDLNEISHNSLNKVISLNKTYYKSSLYLFAEKIDTVSTIYLYVFYGDDIYQFIKVEPDNILKREYNETANLFLPRNIDNMKVYPPNNITLLINPLYSPYVHHRNTTMVLNINCLNIGLMIESRIPEKESINYENNDSNLNISFLDYFDGFNNSYKLLSPELTEVNNNRNFIIAKDKFESYIIESVSDSNYVIQSLMCREDLLFLFYNHNQKEHLMQVYKVSDEVVKVGIDQNYYNIFEKCNIVFAKHIEMEIHNSTVYIGSQSYQIPFEPSESRIFDLIIVQCLNDSDVISAAYELKLFQIQIDANYTLTAHKLISFPSNRLVQDVQIVKSTLSKDDLYLVVLTIDRMTYDTMIYFISLNCTHEDFNEFGELDEKDKSTNLTCLTTDFYTFSGLSLKLDQFVVNSFMFLAGEPLLVVSVNNFGLLIIDIVSKSIADDVCFHCIIPLIKGNFTVLNIIPINNNGIRVFLENKGEFSIYWKKIGKIGDKKHIFSGFKIKNAFKAFDNEETTSLVDFSNIGYSQVVFYNQRDADFKDAFVRVYSNFNHIHSNPLREFRIGPVPSCVSISQSHSLDKIVLVCGSKIYTIRIILYPSLSVLKDYDISDRKYIIESSNSNSKQRIELNYKNTIIDSKIPSWIILCIFMLIILLFSCLIYQIQDKTYKVNKNEKAQQEKEESESILKGTVKWVNSSTIKFNRK